MSQRGHLALSRLKVLCDVQRAFRTSGEMTSLGHLSNQSSKYFMRVCKCPLCASYLHLDSSASGATCWHCGARIEIEAGASWDQSLSRWVDSLAPNADWGFVIALPVALLLLMHYLQISANRPLWIYPS
jgi:hypothetical protein